MSLGLTVQPHQHLQSSVKAMLVRASNGVSRALHISGRLAPARWHAVYHIT